MLEDLLPRRGQRLSLYRDLIIVAGSDEMRIEVALNTRLLITSRARPENLPGLVGGNYRKR